MVPLILGNPHVNHHFQKEPHDANKRGPGGELIVEDSLHRKEGKGGKGSALRDLSVSLEFLGLPKPQKYVK